MEKCYNCIYRNGVRCKLHNYNVDLYFKCEDWKSIYNIYTDEDIEFERIVTVPITSNSVKVLELCSKTSLIKIADEFGIDVNDIKNNKEKIIRRIVNVIDDSFISVQIPITK